MSENVDAPEMPAPRVREFPARSIGGGLALLLGLIGLGAAIALFAGAEKNPLFAVGGAVVLLAALIGLRGLNTVAPGEARVVQLFGRYRGTIRQDGLRWVNPFTSRRKISTRVRNHETAVLKVNDAYGNPIELAAVVVWKVNDTAQATFEVDNYLEFVSTQTEAAVRHIAIEYPYDAHEEDGLSLRGNAEEITEKLAAELHARVEAAGVQIIESRFTHLAYAPPRSPPRCSSGSRPARSSPPGGRSWTAPSAWSRRRSPGSPSRTSSTWTRSARPRWCPT
ncbi:hypothetical protein GCM10020256_26490 [Streptomyces thermocoprophilus]